jgi:hypothetical protein
MNWNSSPVRRLRSEPVARCRRDVSCGRASSNDQFQLWLNHRRRAVTTPPMAAFRCSTRTGAARRARPRGSCGTPVCQPAARSECRARIRRHAAGSDRRDRAAAHPRSLRTMPRAQALIARLADQPFGFVEIARAGKGFVRPARSARPRHRRKTRSRRANSSDRPPSR